MEQFTLSEVSQYYLHRVPRMPQRGRDWRSGCPVHNGKDPNFSVDPDTGMAFCHSQCGRGWDIIELERDITGADFPAAKREVYRIIGRPEPSEQDLQIEATFDYTDHHGILRYQVVRKIGKKFSQRRPKQGGGWIWGLGNQERVPYRLLKLVPAAECLIVEGEKDVHTAERLGYVGTCNNGGAGNFAPELAQWFKDKTCILVADNDEAGRDHVRKVATLLSPIAKEVRILELPNVPEKGDLTDWHRAGGTREELDRLIQSAPRWSAEFVFSAERQADKWVRTLGQFIEVDCGGSIEEFWSSAHFDGLPTPWGKLTTLMAGGLRPADVYVIGANQGAGKTSMALQFALSTIRQKKGVLLFSMEMSHRQVFQRIVSIEAEVDLEKFGRLRRDRQRTFESEHEMAEMSRKLQAHTNELFNLPLYVSTKTGVSTDYLLKECERVGSQQRVDLIIVDHMQLMASTGSGKGDYEKFTAISRTTKEVAMKLNLPVILISQTSRNNAHDKRTELEVSDLRGSGAIEEDASAVLLLYHDPEDRDRARQQQAEGGLSRFSKGPLLTMLKIGKNRWGEAGVYIPFWHRKDCTRFDLKEDHS